MFCKQSNAYPAVDRGHALLRSTLVALVAIAVSGCYTHLRGEQSAQTRLETYPPAKPIEGITYTPPEWAQSLQADLYLPQKSGPHPVVLMVHGGGWANRSRNDMDDISEKLARHGFAVLNVDYRFAPRYIYPAQLHDLQQALRWLDENGARYNLDISRVNTWGFSSGAHLAALVAAVEARTGPTVRAVVAGGIPSDLRKYRDSPLVERFMGGRRDDMPQRYAEASPVYHVSADDPPVFLYHGELDMLVTDDQAIDYHAALRSAGVDSELYLHRWLGHASLFLLGGDAEDKAIQFLNRHNARRQVYAKTESKRTDITTSGNPDL